jgi:hypothetical protein
MDNEITIDDILRGQGADPEKISARQPLLLEIAESARRMGVELIAPHVDSSTFCREEFLKNRMISRDLVERTLEVMDERLKDAVLFTLVVCTIGDGLEKLSNQMIAEDFTLALALDGMGNAAIDRLVEDVYHNICNEAAARDYGASFVSPGSPSWPLEIGQPFIFGLLRPDPSRIRLNQNFLMLPKKSSSFVVGVGPGMKRHGKTCDYCSMSETCRYRIRKIL